MKSADSPPENFKMALSQRYLLATGMQERIDNAAFLQWHAAPGGMIWDAASKRGGGLLQCATRASRAVKTAYAPHREIWQEEYERHIDNAFSAEMLEQIVDFFESKAGSEFLNWQWRMDAYITTNTEELVDQILNDAIRILAEGGP
jgi:hypothetical protein